jgi:hypothetical protein
VQQEVRQHWFIYSYIASYILNNAGIGIVRTREVRSPNLNIYELIDPRKEDLLVHRQTSSELK